MNPRSFINKNQTIEAKSYINKNYQSPKNIELNNPPSNFLNQKLSPSRHWKSYLAPQLSRLQPRQPLTQQFQAQQQLNKVKSMSSLQSYLSSNQKKSYIVQNSQNEGKYPKQNQQFSKRKEQIMNRIKILKEKVSPYQEQTQNEATQNKKLLTIEDRLQAIQNRMDKMEKQIAYKMKYELSQLQKRLRIQFSK